ncbi:MAG: type II toxin-antitoxin system VapC family toxin [Actinomycetota bacterium]
MILDTNAVSAWRDGDIGLLGVIGAAGVLVLPVISLGEYLYGIRNSARRPENQAWLNQIVRALRIAPVTVETAGAYASVRSMLNRKGRPIPANDMWIAALALQHRLPLLSRDSHFDNVDGLTRVGW